MDESKVVGFVTYYSYIEGSDPIDVLGKTVIKWTDIERLESYEPSSFINHNIKNKGILISTYNRGSFVALDVKLKDVLKQWEDKIKIQYD